jgi:uncharacterized phage protein (TIGR02218 family)
MARAFLTAQKTYLAGSTLALCNIVKITRLDGRVFAFTSCDQDLVIEGITYEAYSSADASELAAQVGAGVDNFSIVSLLSSTRIKETELLAGLWDGARCEFSFYAFDNASTVGRLGPLVTGTIGEITEDGGQFTAEVRGLSQRLSQQFVELTSPLCRVRALGDARCMPQGFNEGTNISVPTGTITPTAFRKTGRVVTVVNSTVQITFGGSAEASTIFRHGRVIWTQGANNGLQREIKEHTAGGGSTAVITLQEAMPFVVAVGDVATLEQGCDRTFSMCHALYGNTHNAQNEPQLPGNEALRKSGKR